MDGLGGRIDAESLATLLAVQLSRHQSAAGLPTPRPGARLSSSALGQVSAYVEEHLADDRSLATIAQDIGFASGSHLATHVRRLLGVPPSRLR